MNSRASDVRKFSIKTFGCKVNQYEAQHIRENLVLAGLSECGPGEEPDIFIINSCTVTARADRDARYAIMRAHRTTPEAKIVVTGCYAEKDEAEISALPGVSKVIKNSDKPNLAAILISDPLYPIPDPRHAPRSTPIISGFKGHTKAFVKIQDGCENFCSYCKVPYVRGAFRSRPLADITDEVRTLVSKGYKELVLTGICLGAWGVEGRGSLCEVLEAIRKIEGVFRVRLSSIEPKYVTDRLIDMIASDRRICRHLHIPLQSGDNDVLARMNRPYKREDFRAIVERFRSRIRDAAFTTDVIVGFPGEEERNFMNTLELIKELSPGRTHIFTYSPREGTAAFCMEGACAPGASKERFGRLRDAADSASLSFRRQFAGRRLDVLVQTSRDRGTGLLTGYSDNYIKVLFRGPDSMMNNIVRVNIERVDAESAIGSYGD